MEPVVLNPERYTREGRNWESINISGKDAIAFRTLMDEAHKVGLVSIQTEEMGHDMVKKSAAHRATVVFSDGSVFTGHGDANQDNCGGMVKPSYYRMSETRAIGRALSFGLNVDANAAEEFDGKDGVASAPARPATRARATAGGGGGSRAPRQASAPIEPDDYPEPNDEDGIGYVCEECDTVIKDSAKYSAGELAAKSVQDTGKILCFKHRFPDRA